MLAAATDADYVAPVAVAQQAPPVPLVTTTPKPSTPRPPPSLQLPVQLPQAAETTTTALEQQVRTRQDLEDRKVYCFLCAHFCVTYDFPFLFLFARRVLRPRLQKQNRSLAVRAR